MSVFTTAASTLLLQWLFGVGTPTRPAGAYVALHTNAAPSDANEITTGVGYVRQALGGAMNGATLQNAATLTFGPNTTTNWGSVAGVSIYDSPSAGTRLASGPLASPVTININDSAQLQATQLQVTCA